jgi:hypothetical protein
VSDAGGFLLETAKGRRRHFIRKRGWLLLACAAAPLAIVTAFVLFLPNPLTPWVSEREVTAFWIGAGTVGAVCAVLYLLTLDGGRNLRDGAEAEKRTATALQPLRRRGWRVFHDIQLEAKNIDHALIGSRGAVAVETKWTSDALKVEASGIRKTRLDGKSYPYNGPVQDARRHARDLRLLLRAGGIQTAVLPVLVLWGADVARIEGGARWIGDTLVCVGAQAKEWLDSLAGEPLSEQQIAQALQGLENRKCSRWVQAIPGDGAADKDPGTDAGADSGILVRT